MNELLSIREFSRLSGVESTTLRYWDDIGLFSPVQRDGETNYRYYEPMQVVAVNFIKVLSGLDIPLKTIGASEEERTPESIMDLIEDQEIILDAEMRRLREAYSVIHLRRQLVKRGLRAEAGAVRVERLPERNFILGPAAGFEPDGDFYEPFLRFCRSAAELRINLNYPIGALHDSLDSFVADPGRPHYYFSIDPTGNQQRSAGCYLVGYVEGYYGEMGDIGQRMLAYAERYDLTVKGPIYAVYLFDEVCVDNPSKYLAQLCVAIAPSKRNGPSLDRLPTLHSGDPLDEMG